MKKIISLCMVIILALSMIPNGTIYGENYAGLNLQSLEGECNFTNLIVFARFSDEDEFVDNEYSGNSVRKITDNSYNNADFNVSDYYETASNGKLHMNSVYLFDKGGSIQLSHPRGYYAEYSDENPEGYTDNGEKSQRMYELKTDWSESINRAISAGNVIRRIHKCI